MSAQRCLASSTVAWRLNSVGNPAAGLVTKHLRVGEHHGSTSRRSRAGQRCSRSAMRSGSRRSRHSGSFSRSTASSRTTNTSTSERSSPSRGRRSRSARAPGSSGRRVPQPSRAAVRHRSDHARRDASVSHRGPPSSPGLRAPLRVRRVGTVGGREDPLGGDRPLGEGRRGLLRVRRTSLRGRHLRGSHDADGGTGDETCLIVELPWPELHDRAPGVCRLDDLLAALETTGMGPTST